MRKILKIHIRDTPVRANFGNAFTSNNCPSENCSEKDTQQHLIESSCWLKREKENAVVTKKKH